MNESYRNGLRFHFDSIILYKHESYPSVISLSVLAQEEFGKYLLIYQALSRLLNGENSVEEFNKFIRKVVFHDHTMKQFAYALEYVPHIQHFESLINDTRKYEKMKQLSLYVGLKKNDSISLPFKIINKNKAQKQIKYMNLALIDNIIQTYRFFDKDRIDDENFQNFIYNKTPLQELFLAEILINEESLDREEYWSIISSFKDKLKDEMIINLIYQ